MEILLSSETFIKSITNISDNVAGKYILPSLREAQNVGLKGIVGSCLLAKLKELATIDTTTHTRPIDAQINAAYKELVEQAQYYLAYKTLVEVANKVSYKITNFGVAKSTDENLQVASFDEIAKQQYYYEAKADAACRDLQKWILDNAASFPELDACACEAIRSNLYSSASCGLFLGGARGKKLPGGGGCCR
ncbi:MAG: hypothetical protein K6A62_04720 [Bacteroidales bacterium]|nr:hypothetical protein [Bacteroidales bacterium]